MCEGILNKIILISCIALIKIKMKKKQSYILVSFYFHSVGNVSDREQRTAKNIQYSTAPKNEYCEFWLISLKW